MQASANRSAVLEQLDRIVSHSLFARADRLRRFLHHIVERTLDGQTDTLKESLLGQEVFDRGSRFDPKADPIVRIDARRLRQRLAQYYEGPGAADAVRISVDPGSYVPRFTGPAPAKERTIAVLPFRTSAANESLAQELNEAVSEELAQTSGVRLMARHTVLQWAASNQPQTRFGVDVVLRGDVRAEADQLHVSVTTADAAGRETWSRGFRGSAADWFTVQEEIRKTVAQALAGDPMPKRPRRAPVNRSAHQLFLRGKHELSKASSGIPTRRGTPLPKRRTRGRNFSRRMGRPRRDLFGARPILQSVPRRDDRRVSSVRPPSLGARCRSARTL